MSNDGNSPEPSILLRAADKGVRDSRRRDLVEYLFTFGKLAEDATASGDTELAAAYDLLRLACAIRLHNEADDQPFNDHIDTGPLRAVAIQDFTETSVEQLLGAVNKVNDPELQSRIADLLWCIKRQHDLASTAVDAYCRSAQHLQTLELGQMSAADRIGRAASMALRLGREHPALVKIKRFIEQLLSDQERQPTFANARIVELAAQVDAKGAGELALYAEVQAATGASANNWLLSRRYWELATLFHAKNRDMESAKRAGIEVSETYVRESENALKRVQPSYLTAASFVESAIHALRRVPGTQQQRTDLHKLLLEYQAKGVNELVPIEVESPDLSGLTRWAEEQVRGKPLADAVFAIAILGRSPSVKGLRDSAEKSAKQFLSRSVFPTTALNQSGKVVARHPAAAQQEQTTYDAAITAQMFRDLTVHHHVHAFGAIEPARRILINEHAVLTRDLMPIVYASPFIPTGREFLYAQGLAAGMQGRFSEAVHILIPQLENSIRFVLEQRGIIASGFDQDGIQDEFDLNRTLRMEELKPILGENMVFDLRCVFIERAGWYFRNALAHGLLGAESFYSEIAIYSWWIILRLCCLPLIHGSRATSLTA